MSVLSTAASLPSPCFSLSPSCFLQMNRVSVLWSRPCLWYSSVQFPPLNAERVLFSIIAEAVAVVKIHGSGLFVSRMSRRMGGASQWLWINMEPSVPHKFAFVWDKLGLALTKKCSALTCWADSRWRLWMCWLSLDPGVSDVVLVIITPFFLGNLESAAACVGEVKESLLWAVIAPASPGPVWWPFLFLFLGSVQESWGRLGRVSQNLGALVLHDGKIRERSKVLFLPKSPAVTSSRLPCEQCKTFLSLAKSPSLTASLETGKLPLS